MLSYNIFRCFYDGRIFYTFCCDQFIYTFIVQYTPIWLPHTDVASILPFSCHLHFCHTERYSMHLHIRRIFAFSPHDSHSFRIYSRKIGIKKRPISHSLIGLTIDFLIYKKLHYRIFLRQQSHFTYFSIVQLYTRKILLTITV